MASSNRIIGAADVTDVRQFKLDDLQSTRGASGLGSPSTRSKVPSKNGSRGSAPPT